MDPTTDKPPRKFPAPCWGQSETLTLISSYRDRWYSLRRGFLRSPDWEYVAADVSQKSPSDLPKTPAQCRHKIEKLRQRYRSEKVKAMSFPGVPFSSSWFFFGAMDQMETGGNSQGNNVDYASLVRIKGVGGSESMGLGQNLAVKGKNYGEIEGSYRSPEMGLDQNSVNLAMKGKNYGEIEGNYRKPNMGLDQNSVNLAMKGKNYGEIEGNYRNPRMGFEQNLVMLGTKGKNINPNVGLAYMGDVDGNNFGPGVQFRMPFEEKVVTAVPKSKKIGQIRGDYGSSPSYVNGYSEDLPPGFRAKSSIRCETNTNVINGVPAFMSGKKSLERGVKRERRRDAVDEIVSAVDLLGEEFVRMESMKMEMAREMEKTRMEMELKRNKLILESQRQIVDAFVGAMLGNNGSKKMKKSPKIEEVPES